MITTAITPHPDQLSDWIKTKEIQRGSKQAIEDKAIAAYHKALDDGRTKEEAEKEYFKHFNKGTNGASANTVEGNKRRVA
jgi:hypothetical protein